MDHHHHQNQWRPRPVQGSICPVCSITHFPFCPPHPQFNPNNRIPSEPVYPRPVFDPYRAPPVMHGDPRNLYRNPNLDAQFHGKFQFQPHREGCGPPQYDYGGSNGFVGEGGDRNCKRQRVDEASPGSGALTNDNYLNSVRVFSEDERRLKLIRDHGGASIAPPHGGPDMVPGVNSGLNREANWNAEMNSFQDPGFGGDRKGQFLQTKEQYLQSNENGFYSGDFGPNNVNHQLHKSHRVAYPNSVVPTENYNPYNLEQNQPLNPFGTQHQVHLRHDFHSPSQLNNEMIRPSYEGNLQSQYGNQGPIGHQNLPEVSQYAAQMEASRLYSGQPPLPASPPPPLPLDPPVYSSPPKKSSSLFPVTVRSTAITPSAHPLARHYVHSKTLPHVSTDFATEETQAINKMFSNMYEGEGHPFKLKQLSSDKPKVIDASHLFRQSYRATRPDHIVIILRGLPGSGKSYLAKLLRDLEVENGGNAPRIHSMDDYFMTEVEKDEESDVVNSSSSIRGKKRIMKKVMEYCYEPEMEEGYRSSMLKAFKKTLEEGVFTFVIVDDRNLRVADFAQFWAIGKRSGYEVYILEATYKDPAGCAARNVHGFTQDDIQKMAEQWEEAPPLYLQLDIKSLFQGDDLKESGIQEIDMDMEDEDFDGSLSGLDEEKPDKAVLPPVEDDVPNGFSNDMKRWDADGEHPTGEVKELGRSKWSDDLDEDDTDRAKGVKSNFNALSGLLQAYAKQGKSVHWGDQLGNAGFSIGAAKKANMLSLVIGPGVGYNLKSNPLPEEERTASTHNAGESKGQSVFQERLRAERESFKAVFDRRRHRIGGLNED